MSRRTHSPHISQEASVIRVGGHGAGVFSQILGKGVVFLDKHSQRMLSVRMHTNTELDQLVK